MQTSLRFFNRTEMPESLNIIMFQQNLAPDFNEEIVVWRQVDALVKDEDREVQLKWDMSVGLLDSDGNYTQRLATQAGKLFRAALTNSGHQIVAQGEASEKDEVQILNALELGAVSAMLYRGGVVVGRQGPFAPRLLAAFNFDYTVRVGIVATADTGTVIAKAVAGPWGELNLKDVAGADVIVAGGRDSPLTFTLEGIVRRLPDSINDRPS